jgi:hypothetical protein
MQVRQDRAFRFDPGNPFQRLINMEMARMRRSAQGVDDPDVEAGQRRNTVRRQALDVCGVSDITKTEPERGDVAMILQDGQELDRASLPCIVTGLPATRRFSEAIGAIRCPVAS